MTLAFTSLSKRSNVPGLRSGFVAGDAALIKAFALYRTYHGCAMSPVVQTASAAAWDDEAHVVENRRQYREKFAQVTPLLAEVLDVRLPDAGFYLWAGVPASFADAEAGLKGSAAYAALVEAAEEARAVTLRASPISVWTMGLVTSSNCSMTGPNVPLRLPPSQAWNSCA